VFWFVTRLDEFGVRHQHNKPPRFVEHLLFDGCGVDVDGEDQVKQRNIHA
jgi:hypothetical protein